MPAWPIGLAPLQLHLASPVAFRRGDWLDKLLRPVVEQQDQNVVERSAPLLAFRCEPRFQHIGFACGSDRVDFLEKDSVQNARVSS